MSPAAHLARIRTAHRRIVALDRAKTDALDLFAARVRAAQAAGVSVNAAAREIGLSPSTVRQKLAEADRRREKRGGS